MKLTRAFRRRLRRGLIWVAALALVLVALINNWVVNNSEAYVYSNWSLLPDNEVGLVLGTSPFTRSGKPNPQFYGRIEAAVQLYQLGKIKKIIVSGANPDSTYNEPRQMWRELTKAGIPSQAITMDFAGVRTFDSISRAKAVFNLEQMTVITQEYHAYRAVFIAKKLNIRVAGYAATSDNIGMFSRTYIREVFARVKAVLDLYVLSTEPKFLGSREVINTAPEIEMQPPP
ncbi:ElyC/SanA/YdcF family protein [uncultured Nevskia sp.]|uniref:SanA/YdcF family protein n=1 Tax=uncultured Nevskia sp. TaxID=228950 RepID=UPI0025ED10D1|nr:ElyC/SanA/YdcF family protein [uncultured Nevskia sp.]